MTSALTFDTCIEQFNSKKEQQQDLEVAKASIKVNKDATQVTLGSKEYVLDETGLETLAQVLKIPSRYFKKFPMENELSEHINVLLQDAPTDPLVVRTDGNCARAFVPKTYQVYDNVEIVRNLKAYENHFPAYKLSVLEDSPRKSQLFISFGETITKEDEVYPMLRVFNSEVNLHSFVVEMGLFRVVCSNGMVRKVRDYGFFKWNHSVKSAAFLNMYMNIIIEKSMEKWSKLQYQFEALRQESASFNLMQTIEKLINHDLFTPKFASHMLDFAKDTPILSKYNFVNAITSLAQAEKSHSVRVKHEDLATKILENVVAI